MDLLARTVTVAEPLSQSLCAKPLCTFFNISLYKPKLRIVILLVHQAELPIMNMSKPYLHAVLNFEFKNKIKNSGIYFK